MEVREGFMPFLGYQTYYCVIGDLKSGKTPLLALHGGPGGKSERLRNLEPQVESGRALVLYDQIGGGKSAIEGSHKELWNSAIWIQELIALRQHLELTEIHLMGQSWGGMLALQYVIEEKPPGLKSLVLASTMASVTIWQREGRRLLSYLPQEVQDAVSRAEETGDYDSEEYKAALEAYARRYVGDKLPPAEGDPVNPPPSEAYRTAWGPSEFICNGTLQDWEYAHRLHEVSCPTLITSGLMDECTPLVAKQMLDGISNARWELFEYSRHGSYYQEKDKYNQILRSFLDPLG